MLTDLRYAVRGLARTPGYAAAFALTLGLGIGANTAIFSAADRVLLRPLPYTEGERLVYLRNAATRAGIDNALFSVPEIEDYRRWATSLDGVAEFSALTFTVLGLDEPRRMRAGIVTGNYFDVMGLAAGLGRTIGAGDDGEAAAPVAVLTDELWRRAFAADPDVLGRALRMNGRSVEIVGVAEPAPPYPERTDLYLNMTASPHHLGATMTQDRRHRMTEVFARLAPGVTVAAVASEIGAITARLHAEHPDAYDPSQGYRVTLIPLREQLARRARPALLTLLGVSAFVLAIACANVANLTLARVLRRRNELVVRAALGAGDWRLRRQLLAETLVPSLAGAALGGLLASLSVELLATYVARYSARAGEITIDGRALAAALTIAVTVACLFALLPRLPRALADGVGAGRATSGASGRRLQRLLVVSQVAVSFVLLFGAGLLLRTLWNLQRAGAGLELERVLSMELPALGARLPPEQRAGRYDLVLERVGALPGVHGAAFGGRVPLRGVPTGLSAFLAALEFRIEGMPVEAGAAAPRADFRPVSPGYFRTLGISLLEGRTFDTRDRADSEKVVVINRSMAVRHFGHPNPVDRRLAWSDDVLRFIGASDEWRRIVGVVSDSNDYGVERAAPDVVFQPLAQEPAAGALFVRSARPAAVAPAVVATLRKLDPDQPIENLATLSQVRDEAIAPQRVNATLVGLFAALAALIAAVGVAGVLGFDVSQRTRELGIRAALGAGRPRLLAMVLADGGSLAVAGLALGGLAAAALARLLAGLLFGVAAWDPATFFAVAIATLGAALAASFAPAWRAARVVPSRALRAE